MSYKKGMRVGAMSHVDGNNVYLFGYGVYVGDEMNPNLGMLNPKIKLDSGKVVWGCECWWGPEDEVRQRVKGMKIINLDIDEQRAKYKGDSVAS